MRNSILKYLGWNDQLSTELESQLRRMHKAESYIYWFIKITANAPLIVTLNLFFMIYIKFAKN